MFIRQVKTENGWVRGIQAADPRITAAYALSVVGDWFMAHSGGKDGDRRLMGGILFFFLAP